MKPKLGDSWETVVTGLAEEDDRIRDWVLETRNRLRSLEKHLGLTYDTDPKHVGGNTTESACPACGHRRTKDG